MSRWLYSNPSEAEEYGFKVNGSGTGRPVAVDFRTPTTELERSGESELEPEETLPHGQVRMFRWLFEQRVLREDGRIHVAAGIAMRMCCLASLLRLYPVDAMTFEQIANHCGVTRAAVSKVMLDLGMVT